MSARERDPRGDRYNRTGSYQPSTLAQGPKTYSTGRPVDTRSMAPVVARKVDSAVVAVDDPLEKGARIQATVNRRVDVLEEMRAYKRISVSEYEIGRQLQAIFERASGARLGSPGLEPTASRDMTVSHERAILRKVDDARLVHRLVAKIERAIGRQPTRFIRLILSESWTMQQYAASIGFATDHGVRQVSAHFRMLLSALDADFAAHGSFSDEIRAYRGEAEGVETDDRGRIVPAGQGSRFGGNGEVE